MRSVTAKEIFSAVKLAREIDESASDVVGAGIVSQMMFSRDKLWTAGHMVRSLRLIPVNKISQASRISAVMKPCAVAGEHTFVQVKYLITDVITRLQAESSSETAVKYFCDEEMAKSAVKKEDIEAGVAKRSSVELNSFKRETAVSRSNGMDGDVAELHADLGDRLRPMRVDEAMQQTASTQQPHRSQQRHQQQAVQRREDKKEEAKRQREKERRNEEARKEGKRTGEGVKNRVRKEGEEGGSKVVEDVGGSPEEDQKESSGRRARR